MDIDQDAPLKARKDLVIDTSPDRVWAVLTDIERWPDWQDDVSSATLDGDLAAGAVFRWKALGLNITSKIQELDPGRRIGWTGNSIGMKAIHIWTLERQENATRVTTEESLSGWFPRVLKIFDPSFLEKSLSGSLEALRDQAEKA